jgi:putative endonuclease
LYHVYILYSSTADQYYIGSAAHIENRLTKHLSNHSGFTGKAKDWQLVWQEVHLTKSLALKREKQIKNWKSRKMLEKLIGDKN